jgi:hypothetical protein
VPLFSPVHVLIYFIVIVFLMFATFIPPFLDSPYAKAIQGYPWWILPTVGLSSMLWGVIWWFRLKIELIRRKRKLIVKRTPFLEKDEAGNYVQTAELVERRWLIHVKSDLESEDGDDVFEMTGAAAAGS